MKDLVSKRSFLKHGAALASTLLPALTARPATAAPLALKPQQKFAGFGVNTWPNSPHIAQRDRLLRDLNAAFLRSMLPTILTDKMLTPPVSTSSLYNLIRDTHGPTDPKMQNFGAELASLNIKMHALFWNPPLSWLRPIKNKTHLADSTHIADYAHFVTANLLYLLDQGITPAAVELTNEPNGNWNTQFTPVQYDQLLVFTRQAMDDAGMSNIPIEGPGVSGDYSAFMQELKKTGHIDLLGAYSFHEYDTLKGPEPAGLYKIRPSLTALPPLPINITEFSDMAPHWHTATGPFAKGGAAFDPDFGIAVAGEALQLIADGANEILVWHLEDLPWMQSNSGLLDRTGNTKPLGRALVSLFGLVMPGSSVFVPPKNVPKVPIALFQFAKTATVCAVNLREQSVEVSITSLPATSSLLALRHYSGQSESGTPASPSINVVQTGCTLQLPPRSSLAAQFAIG